MLACSRASPYSLACLIKASRSRGKKWAMISAGEVQGGAVRDIGCVVGIRKQRGDGAVEHAPPRGPAGELGILGGEPGVLKGCVQQRVDPRRQRTVLQALFEDQPADFAVVNDVIVR